MNCRNSSEPSPRRTWSWLKAGLFTAALALLGTVQAQTITTTFANNNGSSVVVFSIQNNDPTNAYLLTTIGSVANFTGTGTARLYAKPATYNVAPGAAGAITSLNGWTDIGSNTALSTTANTTGSGSTATTWISGMTYSIAPLSQVRFCLQHVTAGGAASFSIAAGSIRYSTVGVQTCSFLGGNLTLNACANYAYGGTMASPTNSPRGFIGFVTLIASVPCAGNNGGTATFTGGSSACSGSTKSMSSSGASSGIGIAYQWEVSNTGGGIGFGNVVGGSGATTVSYTTAALTVGTYYYRLRVTCVGTGYSNEIGPLTVNPLPTASASSNSPICAGAALNLTGTTNIGTTYSWSGPNAYTSTSLSPTIASATAAAAGTYSFVATANGCSSAAATTAVVVNITPVITTPASATPPSVCNGGNSQLSVATSVPGGVASYAFSSTTGTYTTIDGAPGTIVTNTGSDDSSWGPYALGFTFNFNGTAFTTAGVCDNGFIAFGGAATSSYTSLSSGTANNVAAAFNYDLYGLAGNGAKLMYQLSGSPGSQVYTFEWKNWGFYSLGANELSFQIKLYEGSNRVQFVYQNGTGTATSAVQVGLRGTTAASFLNRTTATDWNATTAGAVNTATCSVSSTVRPTNGLIYNWDPPSASISWLPITYLDNPAIATPLASGVGATTIYTATANSGGCTATSSATVTVANPLASGSTITPASPFYCGPTGSVTLTAIPGGGGGPWNFQWTDPLLNVGPTTTTATQVANIPGVWSVYITDACGGFDNASTTVVQRAVPTATAGSNVGCLGQALNLTGATDIGTTYAWTGPNAFTSAALNPTIASVVAANAGVYSFTAAFNGCTSLPSTVTVGANPVPSITSVTATLATICAGSTSQLNAVATINGNYTVGAITYAPPSPISTSLSGVGPTGDEGTVSATIGFPFSFFGTSYSSVTVHTNGYIVFSGYVFGAYSPPAIPNTANTNNWVGYWADLNASAGQITYGTIGTTPNRKFIVNYNQEPYYSATPYYSGQVVLNEFDNTIDVFMEHTQTTNTSACGLENPTGTLGTAAPGRNSGIWAATNEAWKFTPTALTYAWTPAGTLSNAALSNPVATPATTTPYAVMVTSNAGCIANGAVTVNVVTSCDDSNPCTLDACLNGVCSHTFQDADGDGTCDVNDGCPNDPLKIAPGICGCGISDADGDGDGTANCLDGCPADPLKIAPGICGCGVSDADTDGDGTVDCNDGCPADPLKIAPGQCGCGIADTDSDGDGTANCNDLCPGGPEPGTACDDGVVCTINDVIQATCVCDGTHTVDTDGDGFCDAIDLCPVDPNKQFPGQCGCGNSDLDTDGDGTSDCNDLCPLDPLKLAPGQCGCGIADTDNDGDGTANCNDGCPNDPLKLAAGICGCGVSDVDTDSDGTADCLDGCPTDPLKVAPGQCGCGQLDTDSDGDGVANCVDNCPNTPGVVGTPCDDGNPTTVADQITNACVCAGVPAACSFNLVALTLNNGANASQTSWDIVPSGGGAPACSGSGYVDNSTITLYCCLPNGCYDLQVFDSFGDGMVGGGYVLRNAANNRIIDNTGNGGTFTTLSQAALSFCVPIGSVTMLAGCDLQNLFMSSVMQSSADPAVTAIYGTCGNINCAIYQNTGYQWWAFNPNGGYTRRVFQSITTPGSAWPLGTVAPIKPTYLSLSTMSNAPALPIGTVLNMRVRSRVNGVYGEFGPACQFKVDPNANCATSQLTTTADPIISCGATSVSQSTGVLWATSVASANKYQFEFTNSVTNIFLRRIGSSTRNLNMNTWGPTNPLPVCNVPYNVRVRVSFDNGATYCNFGAFCQVTFCGGPSNDHAPEVMAVSEPGTLELWPNPNRGDQVNVRIDDLGFETGTATIELIDIFGKHVKSETISVDGSRLFYMLDLSKDIADGLYFVNITAGDNTFTQRLVIAK